MKKEQARAIIDRLNDIYGKLDKKKDVGKREEYGRYLMELDYMKMMSAVDEVIMCTKYDALIVDLQAAYSAQCEKERMLLRIEKEKHLQDKVDKGEYIVKCMVCLDHGIIWYDKEKNGKIYQYTAFCDQCSEGKKHMVYHTVRDQHGKVISNECVDTPISSQMNPNTIREWNENELHGAELTRQPAPVYIRLRPQKVSQKSLDKGLALLKSLGINPPKELEI